MYTFASSGSAHWLHYADRYTQKNAEPAHTDLFYPLFPFCAYGRCAQTLPFLFYFYFYLLRTESISRST
jgi:hypothetical protein